ncbi:glycosyltransferase family 2 protein [Legionella clemsonensis]|uniref:N-acetylglucosaminyl-diphospho-decaprenol L-rhamnosyltransferase n=1 Tax=Legionella clemsonensis TaxID=1867846 RepID=A0A222P3I0_9GAMM|nr:glycosyltransferase family 2 protein [Legionella clemsonensis]ASQ46414.1 N-acetylglucosaminyl-diphospho-decaprenol L-rhamnosyltransferase [Legionella clemsonensis]
MVEQVTVIIVNYNSGEMLTRCIAKILESTRPVKILVSDNASTDNSLQFLEENFKNHPAIHVHRNRKNFGFSTANNAVYPLVTTPFILYLNPDCFLEKDTIEHFLKLMNEYPGAGMAGCLVTNMDGTEQTGCRGLTPTPRRIINQLFKLFKLFPRNPKFAGYLLSDQPLPNAPTPVELISGSCMFVRKQAIDEIGLLDENYFLYCEDYDWFYRFTQSQWKLLFTPNTKVAHIKSFSAQQIPFRVLLYKARGMWRYHDKFFKTNSHQLSTLLIRAGIILRLIALGSILFSKRVFISVSRRRQIH